MKQKQDLERMHLNDLVRKCQDVMGNAALDLTTRNRAEQLKAEWMQVVSQEASSSDSRAVQAEQEKLKASMVDLLVTI